MATRTIQATDSDAWEQAGLSLDRAGEPEFRNERESGFGGNEGEWAAFDDERFIVYSGTFGNDHSPGSSHNTWATLYDDRASYEADRDAFLSLPEWVGDEDDESDDDE